MTSFPMNRNRRANAVKKPKRKRLPGKEFQGNRGSFLTERSFGKFVPDQIEATFVFTLPPTIMFNTAATYNGNAYYMNSTGNGYSGVPWQYDYLVGMAELYRACRVLDSHIEFTFSAREANESTFIVVVPTDASTVASNSATFSELMLLPYAKQIALAGTAGGLSVRRLRSRMQPEKLIGQHYNQQDEYSAAPFADPARLLYWNLAVCNVDTFTATTGGVTVSVKCTQRVLLYELERDTAVTIQPKTVEAIDKMMTKLSLQRQELLAKEKADKNLKEKADTSITKC